jgi:hypothetical protein
MSRILRRPMFRGGRVDSRGTGITSGLSYAKGGRVGLRLGGSPYLTSPVQFSGDPFTSQAKLLQNIKDQINAVTGAEIVENQKSKSFLNNFDNLFGEKDTVKTITLPDGSTKQVLTESEGPSTGVLVNLPKFMGGISREEKKIRDQKNELEDNFEVSGNVAGVREGETALDAVMREALAKKNNIDNTKPKLDNDPANPEIDKDTIKKYKDMFREAYGSGRGDDVSSMLMNFAGKALKPEATVKSAFGEFFEEEGKRPSKRKQYDEAAATAAINAYIAGEKSMADTKKALAIYDKKLSQATAAENSKTITTRMNEDKGTQRSELKKLIGNTAEFMEDNNIPGVPQQIKKEQAEDPALLTEENIGAVFIDTDSKKVFIIVADVNGNPVKEELYSG